MAAVEATLWAIDGTVNCAKRDEGRPALAGTVEIRRIVGRRCYGAVLRRVNKTIEVVREGHREACMAESVRAYGYGELSTLLKDAGLEVVRAFGACDGRAFAADAPRLILLAVKRPDV